MKIPPGDFLWYAAFHDEGDVGAGAHHAGQRVRPPGRRAAHAGAGAQLGTIKGKKSYGYLPKRLKNLVDEIVDEMERLPAVSKCYDQWLML